MKIPIAFAVCFLSVLLQADVGFHDTFEDDMPGLLPKNWKLMGYEKKGEKKELCRYVSNIESCGGDKCLVYDFSQMPIVFHSGQKAHAYTARNFPAVRDGWLCLSFCFKRSVGKLSVEMRGKHKNGNSISIPWWITIGDTVTMKSASHGRKPSVIAGSVSPNSWHRINFKFPTVGGKQKNARIRLDRYLGKGRFAKGVWKDVPVGEMELTAPYSHFDFTGHGKSKYYIDDVIVRHLEKD